MHVIERIDSLGEYFAFIDSSNTSKVILFSDESKKVSYLPDLESLRDKFYTNSKLDVMGYMDSFKMDRYKPVVISANSLIYLPIGKYMAVRLNSRPIMKFSNWDSIVSASKLLTNKFSYFIPKPNKLVTIYNNSSEVIASPIVDCQLISSYDNYLVSLSNQIDLGKITIRSLNDYTVYGPICGYGIDLSSNITDSLLISIRNK